VPADHLHLWSLIERSIVEGRGGAQVAVHVVLLKNSDSTVTECMSRPDRNPKLLAEWFQHMSIYVIHDQGSVVFCLEDRPL
jgi:hypothetical protein